MSSHNGHMHMHSNWKTFIKNVLDGLPVQEVELEHYLQESIRDCGLYVITKSIAFLMVIGSLNFSFTFKIN